MFNMFRKSKKEMLIRLRDERKKLHEDIVILTHKHFKRDPQFKKYYYSHEQKKVGEQTFKLDGKVYKFKDFYVENYDPSLIPMLQTPLDTLDRVKRSNIPDYYNICEDYENNFKILKEVYNYAYPLIPDLPKHLVELCKQYKTREDKIVEETDKVSLYEKKRIAKEIESQNPIDLTEFNLFMQNISNKLISIFTIVDAKMKETKFENNIDHFSDQLLSEKISLYEETQQKIKKIVEDTEPLDSLITDTSYIVCKIHGSIHYDGKKIKHKIIAPLKIFKVYPTDLNKINCSNDVNRLNIIETIQRSIKTNDTIENTAHAVRKELNKIRSCHQKDNKQKYKTNNMNYTEVFENFCRVTKTHISELNDKIIDKQFVYKLNEPIGRGIFLVTKKQTINLGEYLDWKYDKCNVMIYLSDVLKIIPEKCKTLLLVDMSCSKIEGDKSDEMKLRNARNIEGLSHTNQSRFKSRSRSRSTRGWFNFMKTKKALPKTVIMPHMNNDFAGVLMPQNVTSQKANPQNQHIKSRLQSRSKKSQFRSQIKPSQTRTFQTRLSHIKPIYEGTEESKESEKLNKENNGWI